MKRKVPEKTLRANRCESWINALHNDDRRQNVCRFYMATSGHATTPGELASYAVEAVLA